MTNYNERIDEIHAALRECFKADPNYFEILNMIGDMGIHDIESRIIAVLEADRKRVALEEWEIANKAVLKNIQLISNEQERLEALALVDPKKHNDKIGSYMDKAFGFDLVFQPFAEARRKRIAELKAQEEEV